MSADDSPTWAVKLSASIHSPSVAEAVSIRLILADSWMRALELSANARLPNVADAASIRLVSGLQLR